MAVELLILLCSVRTVGKSKLTDFGANCSQYGSHKDNSAGFVLVQDNDLKK